MRASLPVVLLLTFHGCRAPLPVFDDQGEKDLRQFGLAINTPTVRKQWDFSEGLCPKAEKICKETVILPWNEGLTENM
jgi:hypothetical protein